MARKLISAGDLRHRVAIQERVTAQDSDGNLETSWVTVNDQRGNWSSLPAACYPMSAREFEAAGATQAETLTRFVLRFGPDIKPAMRLVHAGQVYDIRGVLPDMAFGRDYITLPCAAGVNNG